MGGSDLLKWPGAYVEWHFYNRRRNLSAHYSISVPDFFIIIPVNLLISHFVMFPPQQKQQYVKTLLITN